MVALAISHGYFVIQINSISVDVHRAGVLACRSNDAFILVANAYLNGHFRFNLLPS